MSGIIQSLIASYPAPSGGAIAFDASSFSSGTTGTSHTLSHTCTGSDRILFWSTLQISTSDTLTGVTYNGVAMTRIAHVGSTGERIYLYYLINPSTGTNNIVATTSASATIYAQSTSYTGAKQSGQPDSSNTSAYATRTNLSTSTTTIADNSWVVGVFRAGTTQTAGSGTTFRAGVNATIKIGDSNGPITPAGSTSLGATFSSGGCAQIVASFSPA